MELSRHSTKKMELPNFLFFLSFCDEVKIIMMGTFDEQQVTGVTQFFFQFWATSVDN